MWIKRKISSILEQITGQFPAVVLTGARQVGKTSLLQHMFKDYRFVSLDHPSNANLAQNNPELFLQQNPPPLIIDEIQYAPGLFRYLKIYIDQHRAKKGQFILTGSQKFNLMHEVSESLSGRCGIIELETLSFQEINKILPEYSILNSVILGGYPELYAEANRNKQFYFESYLATYLERDIRSLLKVHNLRDFERFVRACAFRSGQILNKAELAKDVGISPTTANEWLTLLQTSNQVYLLEPWFHNKTKELIKSPKIYLCDTGLLCHLYNINSPDDFIKSPAAGAIWETYVCAELRKHQEWQKGRPELWLFRNLRQFEIDFVINKGNRLHLIECKLSENPTIDDAKNLLSIEKLIPARNILSRSIISTGNYLYTLDKAKINVYPLSQLPEFWF